MYEKYIDGELYSCWWLLALCIIFKLDNIINLYEVAGNRKQFGNSRQAVCLEKAGTASKSVAMWTPLLAITSLAVYIRIGSIAGYNRIQGLCTVATFETLPMPFATLS